MPFVEGMKLVSVQNSSVLCGSCKCAVETVANPKPHDKVACPRCGRSDRFDQVMNTIGEYVVHLTQEALAERMAKANRSNSFIKFEMKKPSYRSFRWIAENVRV
jgi:hypothetical protein